MSKGKSIKLTHLKLIRDNIEFKTFTQEDILPEYLSWLNDQVHMKFSRNAGYQHSFETSIRYLQSFENTKNQFIAMYRGGSLIGTATLYSNSIEHSCDIGILIGSEFSGQGLGFDCFSALIDIASWEYDFPIFTAGTHSENLPMLRIFQKLGLSETTGNSEFHLPDHRYFEGKHQSGHNKSSL